MNLTYDTYLYICYGAAALSIVFLIAAVVLFFVWKIPNVIGDLTGANARKGIAEIRDQNEATGIKQYKPSAVNRERGKITDKISSSGKLVKNPTANMGGHATSKLQYDQQLEPAAQETMVLDADMQQQPLAPIQETTVLDPSVMPGAAPAAPEPFQQWVFAVEYEVTYIHTNEVIT